MLNKMVNKELWMDMRDECAYSRMDNLFLNYFMIVKKNGCEWAIENAPKVAAKHILSKIRPDPVRNRIGNDLKLAHADLKKDFDAFREHCLKLSEALAILEDKENREPNEQNVTNMENKGSDTDTCISITRPASRSQPQAQKLPKCPHPDCMKQTDEKRNVTGLQTVGTVTTMKIAKFFTTW